MICPVLICTRGSALALAQATGVRDDLRRAFPDRRFELQTAVLAKLGESLPKRL